MAADHTPDSQSDSMRDPVRDLAPDDPRALWQTQAAPTFQLTEETLATQLARAESAQKRMRRLAVAQRAGVVLGSVACIAVAIIFTDPLMRIGAVLLALAFAYYAVVLRSLPSSEATPVVSTQPTLAAYRAALVRRIAEDSGARLWGRLAIGAPAAALFLYGFARAYPTLANIITIEAVAVAAGLTAAFTIAVRRAARYRGELDALDRLGVPGAQSHAR